MCYRRCFYTVHIEEYESMARDTKLGAEEITRDIPNVRRKFEKSMVKHSLCR